MATSTTPTRRSKLRNNAARRRGSVFVHSRHGGFRAVTATFAYAKRPDREASPPATTPPAT